MGVVPSKAPNNESHSSKANEKSPMENMCADCGQKRPLEDTGPLRSNKYIEHHRWLELMYRLQNLSRLHHQGVTASVLERQKRREVAFKRANVWGSDAKFMSEIQILGAEGKLDQFKDLLALAKECQTARDILGPMEDDLAVVAQQWESQIFQLRKAEEDIYTEFKSEFELALDHPSMPENESEESFYSGSDGAMNENIYDQEEAHNDDENIPQRPFTLRTHSSNFTRLTPINTLIDNLEPVPTQTSMLLGIEQRDALASDTGRKVSTDFALGRNPSSEVHGEIELLGSHQSLLLGQNLPIDIAHLDEDKPSQKINCLLSETKAQGDNRIARWLLGILVVSRSQATILKKYIDAENLETPKNWAQLVLALWEDDGSIVDMEEKRRDPSIYIDSNSDSAEPGIVQSAEFGVSRHGNETSIDSNDQFYPFFASPSRNERFMNSRPRAQPQRGLPTRSRQNKDFQGEESKPP